MIRSVITLVFFIATITNILGQDSIKLKSQVRKTIDELKDFVALPNDALNPEDIDNNIIWLRNKFNARGFNTSILETEGLPLFFAALPMDDVKPTILFYMHFDGQSVDASKWNQKNPYVLELMSNKEGQWQKESFDALDTDINYDWRLFGRSTSDDKGPIVMFLNTIDLLKENGVTLPFNVKVILDSEEEKSSAPLPKAVKTYRELLEADFLVINDGPVHASGRPTVVYGCRGITTLSLTAFGPIHPQHSGHYGNYAPNPGFILSKLLASFKDDAGRVIIPGYYDGIVLDDDTQTILKSVPDNDTEIRERLQFNSADKVGAFYQESLQYPSLNIRGLGSGWVGAEARTIVPATATAELDLRLVPESDGNRLKKLVKDFIRDQGFYITDTVPTKEERLKHEKVIMVTEGSVTDAFRTDLSDHYGNHIVNTLKDTFDQDVVQIRIMGGTVPIAPFVNELQIPAFLVPLVNPDNNQHSPNENLKIGQIAYGIQAFYTLLCTPMD
ncbi:MULTISPECIES: M20/M25/M40 family metallo-hydrolase [Maribacter]|uniref:M20/M25/M40 family metallo-hydrolase n=1 Tax=Maribacter flavus TaxID=1658664 RepID=A0ABU7IN35_9FLAO|nr:MULTISPECIES: M20/M25/M40 family metallo-hydrolase [Maribacter]MDC6406863.1 M20/M25/M40 family metallo-hydrolase [Maribacter sp. PR66]MEE1973981.1 M20/M25/M40 family metallo-hydrolase [Maribacter flavus]